MENKKSFVTVRNITRILSLFVIIFVFCPSFLVSCSGQERGVSVMTAVQGVASSGQTLVDPYPGMLICLVLPIAIFVILFIKKYAARVTALICLVCAAADFVIWLIFKSEVEKVANQYYCEFDTTIYFIFNMISLGLMCILFLAALFGKAGLDMDLLGAVSGTGTQIAKNVVINPKEKPMGFCQKCGAPLTFGNKFCTSCGNPIPESLIQEAEAKRAAEEAAAAEAARRAAEEAAAAEAARRAAEEEAMKAAVSLEKAPEAEADADRPRFCSNCGAAVTADAIFCESCGSKIE